ncbi:DUF1820 family protein [Spirochaeta dissipatitropha]
MTIYRVEFLYNDKKYSLKARGLDMTHPYFVSIAELIMPEEKVIIDPETEDIRKKFGKTEHLMIPLQSIQLIEVFNSDPDKTGEEKMRNFSVLSNSNGDQQS